MRTIKPKGGGTILAVGTLSSDTSEAKKYVQYMDRTAQG